MKLFMLFLFTSLTLFAGKKEKISEGEKIFQAKCAICHIKLITKEEALKDIKKLKAPPMVEISNRLKEQIIIKDDESNRTKKWVILAFIKDYVINPSFQKSICKAMAVDRFGVMPSQKGKLSENELQTVAEWIYDYFEGKKF